MHWLYVYYRLPESSLQAARSEALRLFAALGDARALAGLERVTPQLLRRPELRDGDITFMEVYGPVAAPDVECLRNQIDACLRDCPLLLAAPRHTEHFTELPCA